MSSNIYPIINAVLFGIVLCEVLIQIGFSLINKQKLQSTYFKFLVFTSLWIILRFCMSFSGVIKDKRIHLMILDLLYPCIVSSFLLLCRHYISVLYELNAEKKHFYTTIWDCFVLFEYITFLTCAGLEWTPLSEGPLQHILQIIGIGIPCIFAIIQLFLICWYRVSLTNSKTILTYTCEIILNILIVIHFTIDLLNIIDILHIAFTPNNLVDLIFVVCLEIIPIELLLLLVYNFDIRTIVQTEEPVISKDVINQFLKQDFVISSPLLDYSYSRQDVENMVVATNRSHKDSEEFSPFAGSESSNRLHISLGDHYNSLDRNSPSESIGSPPAF